MFQKIADGVGRNENRNEIAIRWLVIFNPGRLRLTVEKHTTHKGVGHAFGWGIPIRKHSFLPVRTAAPVNLLN